MTTTRELPREEWDRLVESGQPEMREAWASLIAKPVHVVVGETAGEIVAHWSVLPVWHSNGLWIRPDHRRRGGTCHALLNGIREIVRADGLGYMWIGTEIDTIQRLAESEGGIIMPGRHYLVPAGERR